MTEALVFAPLVLLVKLCQDAKFYVENGYGPTKAIEIIDAWRKVCGGVASPPHLVHEASAWFERVRSVQEELSEFDAKFPDRPTYSREPYAERVAPLVAMIRERYAAAIVRHVLELPPFSPKQDEKATDTDLPPAPTDLDELSDGTEAAE